MRVIRGGPAAFPDSRAVTAPVTTCWACDTRRAMDRRLAERNLTAGLLAAGLALLCFGLSFFLAVIYIT
jgi:hypothetical protein